MTRTQLRILVPLLAVALLCVLAQGLGLGAAATLALAALSALLLSWGVARALRRPFDATQEWVARIAEGRLDVPPHALQAEDPELARALARLAGTLSEQVARATEDKEQLEAVLAAMVEGVLVVDAEGRIVLSNPRLREILDVWGPVEGRRLLEVARNAQIEAALREASASERVVAAEIEHLGQPERTLAMHAARLPASGPRGATVAVFHDISEIRRLEQVRQDFIANASHELRTPLTAIQGFADTLLVSDASEQARGPLQAIVRNARRLSNLVDDLLTLSRLESHRVPLQATEVDVAALCRTLAEDLAPRLAQASLELTLELEPGTWARADARALEHVISNLLVNAVQYTDAGGRITLRVGHSEPRGRIEVCVADSGVGIPIPEQDRIFERFYRVDQARSRAIGGTGLGLSIVKHLLQAMGGAIRVESAPGRGATFRFDLPASEPPAAVGEPTDAAR